MWNGGVSFGGVVAFIFGDLVIPPLLNIYRKYYGGKVTVFLAISFYIVMVLAALAVEGIFVLLGWVPETRNATVSMAHISLNYTAILNIVFGAVAAALVVMFLRTGGPEMMKMMTGGGDHDHGDHPHD